MDQKGAPDCDAGREGGMGSYDKETVTGMKAVQGTGMAVVEVKAGGDGSDGSRRGNGSWESLPPCPLADHT